MPTESPCISSTPDVALGFSLEDVMAAKVVVKRLVQNGLRKAPSDLLVLPDRVLEEWYNQDAVRYLQEQKAKRQQPVATIP